MVDVPFSVFRATEDVTDQMEVNEIQYDAEGQVKEAVADPKEASVIVEEYAVKKDWGRSAGCYMRKARGRYTKDAGKVWENVPDMLDSPLIE